MNNAKQIWMVNKVSDTKAEILIYGYIHTEEVSSAGFMKELRELEKQYTHIDVRINSGGGSVYEGFAIYNALKNSKAHVETYIDGIAASMASALALSGKKVHMSKVARYMTHKPRMGSFGTASDLRKEAKQLEDLEKSMCGIYAERTGKTSEECMTLFLNGNDNWFSATEAKALGLIDEIYDAAQIDEPAATISEKEVYEHYAPVLAAKIDKTPNTDMKQFNVNSAILGAMALSGDASQQSFEVALNDLVAKAAKVDAIQTKLDTATQELAKLQKNQKTEKVASLLEKAVADKKVNAQMKATLEKQYADNPEGLEELLNSMQAYTPIVPTLQNESKDEPTADAYDKLDRSGGLEKVKAENPERFKALFKAKFGVDPK